MITKPLLYRQAKPAEILSQRRFRRPHVRYRLYRGQKQNHKMDCIIYHPQSAAVDKRLEHPGYQPGSAAGWPEHRKL